MAKLLRVFENCNQIFVVTLVLLLGSWCLLSGASSSSSFCPGGDCGKAAIRGVGSSSSSRRSSDGVVFRRALATGNNNDPTGGVVLTQSLLDDGESLLEFKAAITSDPTEALRYWKRQGKRQVLNACRWPGVTCKHRRVFAVNLFNKQLQGTIPSSSLGQLALLSSLNLSGNFLSGPITTMLQQTGSFPALVSLDLSNNNLTGALPDSSSLASLHNLSFFDVSNNDLRGPIPSQLFSLPALQSLDLSHNSFNGSIPTALNLSSSSQLQNLDLSDNQLSGNISADFLANLTSLVSLDVSRNPLGGVIPATVGQLIHLQSLQLTSCNLTGSIPQEFTACVELRELKLNGNSLQGDIPPSLGGLPQLSSLDLSSNLLEGDFLSFIANTSILQELLLSDNRLNGVIPPSLGTSLQKLTLSLSLSHNQLSGPIPEQLGDLVLVQNLDFSFNSLSGSIPESIGNCSSLLSLIISHNRLEGSIPPQLGNLTKLTQLDLSDNLLSGSIPASLTTISMLSFLNVSDNNLQGLIPNFTHQSSNNNITASSFLDNPGLCGVIINKECQSSSHDTRNKILLGAIVGDELQLRLSAEEILLATGGFGEANIIGRGLTSTIYRGVYNDVDVAVKRLTIFPMDVAVEPDTKLETLASVRHNSLVRVVGYCSSPEIKALVLEYMPNGSLEKLLHPSPGAELVQTFNWNARLNVAIGVAQGLAYLHHERAATTPLVHGNVKPSNILFDAKWRARISDFGMSTILAPDAGASGGASGYIPPEAMASGATAATVKWDVYSYGIVLLEMLSGRRPDDRVKVTPNLPAWIRKTVSESKSLQQVLDPLLLPDLPSHQQRIAMVMGLALMCTRDIPDERPTMKDVLKKLMEIKNRFQNKSQRSSRDSRQSSKQRTLPHTPSLSHWSGTAPATNV
ncbi:unnamed protein product [Sphagnum jensenii]|uniref:Protein kinase domain-containing protein n=1 Tax=Sphagnum jensenii TaxID=128206 RepID=A0ABP0VHC8_9BRYO